MSPTHHYLDTSRARITPGLSILYGGNPCRGNHRAAQGGGERRPCASTSCGEQWSVFCEVERKDAVQPCHPIFVASDMRHRWILCADPYRANRRADRLFLGLWCQIQWTFSSNYFLLFTTSHSFLVTEHLVWMLTFLSPLCCVVVYCSYSQ